MMEFYNGSIGRNLIKDIMRAGGILTMEDLRSYQIKKRELITANVMGLQIIAAPPPASGGAMMILILKILEQYGIPQGASCVLGLHRTIEALKSALATRMEIGDPDFVDTKKAWSSVLSTRYAAKLKSLISDNRTFDSWDYGGKWEQIHDHGTTHICVVDKEQNVVSMTTIINCIFGSTIMSPSTGILLNNQILDFSIPSSSQLPPVPPNFIQPFKRPLSSMTPTIVLKGGTLKAVIGAAGGILIPDAVTEVLLNHFARKMDPLSSVMAPRYYHWLNPNILEFENYSWPGYQYRAPSQTIRFLKSRRHRVASDNSSMTICQFVVQELDGPNAGMLYAVTLEREEL